MKVIFDGIVGQNSNRITNIEKSFLAGKSILGGGGGGGLLFCQTFRFEVSKFSCRMEQYFPVNCN